MALVVQSCMVCGKPYIEDTIRPALEGAICPRSSCKAALRRAWDDAVNKVIGDTSLPGLLRFVTGRPPSVT